MKPRIKEMWVKALQSGKYKRAIDKLVVRNRYDKPIGHCCLGVLADLYIKDNGLKKVKVEDFMDTAGNEVCHTKVLNWAGLHHSTQGTLININDIVSADNRDGTTFRTVIAHIRKFL